MESEFSLSSSVSFSSSEESYSEESFIVFGFLLIFFSFIFFCASFFNDSIKSSVLDIILEGLKDIRFISNEKLNLDFGI